MATIPSPEIPWSSPSLQPQSMAVLTVFAANTNFVPNNVIIYTNGILVAPAVNQLVNDAATGTPL